MAWVPCKYMISGSTERVALVLHPANCSRIMRGGVGTSWEPIAAPSGRTSAQHM